MPNPNEDDDDDVDYGDPYDQDFDEDRSDFADPGGRSALRAETVDNPRCLPCPRCETPNVLTLKDRYLGYQCDSCADRLERGEY